MNTAKSPKEKAYNLNFLASLMLGHKPTEAFRYAQQAKFLAEKNNDTSNLITAYQQIGIYYLDINRCDSAQGSLLAALELCKKSKKKKQESSCLNTLGNVHLELSQKKEALACYLNALRLSEETNSWMHVPMRLANVARAHIADMNFAQANIYLRRAIAQAELLHDGQKNVNALSFALLNMGILHYKANRFDSAKIYYEKALYVENQSPHNQNKQDILMALAEVYEKLGRNNIAENYLQECLLVAKENHENKVQAACFAQLSRVMQAQKAWQKAIHYAELSLVKADSLQLLPPMNEAYNALASSYAGAGDFAQAYHYQQLYKQTSDSIFNLYKSSQFQELQTRYEVNKKELASLEKDKRIRVQRMIIVAVSLLLLLIGFLSISLYRSRKREKVMNEELQGKNKLLEELNVVKDKLFSIIGHDLRAPINSLTAVLGLLSSGNLPEAQAKMLFAKLEKEVQHTADLLETLLTWAKSQLQGMKIKIEPLDIQQIVIMNFDLLQSLADKKNITLSHQVDATAWVKGDEEMIKTVVRNLLANAIKFTQVGGEVLISAKAEGNQVEISVRDNGVGMNADTLAKLFKGNITTRGTQNEKGTGLGLVLVQDFVEKNKGKIRVESEMGKGSTFIVTLPSTLPNIVHSSPFIG